MNTNTDLNVHTWLRWYGGSL